MKTEAKEIEIERIFSISRETQDISVIVCRNKIFLFISFLFLVFGYLQPKKKEFLLISIQAKAQRKIRLRKRASLGSDILNSKHIQMKDFIFQRRRFILQRYRAFDVVR